VRQKEKELEKTERSGGFQTEVRLVAACVSSDGRGDQCCVSGGSFKQSRWDAVPAFPPTDHLLPQTDKYVSLCESLCVQKGGLRT
jgi:hypothetical protein